MSCSISTKIISISKPNFPFHKYDRNRSEILRGGSTNIYLRSRRLCISSSLAAEQPKLDAGVQVFLSKGHKALLGRRRSAIGYGDFALPGGHLEFVVGVGVFLLKGNKVLLGRRRTAVGYGTFALPGGHLEFGETFEECAAREVKEETGLEINGAELLTVTNSVLSEPKPMQLIAVLMRAALADDDDRTAINVEPDKCDGWDWYDWNDLPTPLFGALQTAILQGLDPFPPTY